MSLAASTFQAFKTCTNSLSSRSLQRPVSVRCPTRWSRLGVRCYSGKTTPSSEGSKEDGKSEAPENDAKLEEVEKRLKATKDEVVDLTGRLRYLQADFLNLQRNAAREKEQTRDFAITRFASDLLETVDVLALALKSIPPEALTPTTANGATPSEPQQTEPPSSHDPLRKSHQTYLQELHTGVDMTQRLLLQTLFKYHVKPFDPTGDVFDPNLHEAIYQAPVPGKEPGTVLECRRTGYKIKDRVLRAAQVGVVQETS